MAIETQNLPGQAPCVSILVRTHNDAPWIRRTLDAIFGQAIDLPFEVLVCNDNSTDGTTEILKDYAGRIVEVARPKGIYRPGRTLNAMVSATKGEWIVFNNADAVPLDDAWLSELIAPLRAGVADAVFANQLPRPDATGLVEKDSIRAFGDGLISKDWPRFFSLASSAARRDDLLAHPFSETLWYSEDVEWANRRSIRRQYVPTAHVEHSHNYTVAQLKRRFYGEGYADAQIFGDTPQSVVRTLLSAVRETVRDVAFLLRRPRQWGELAGALPRRWVQRFSYRAGVCDAAAGRSPRTVSTDAVRPADSQDVLFVGEWIGFAGGIERYAFAAAEVLRDRGVRVDYLGTRRARDAERFAAGFNRIVARDPGGYGRVVLHKIPSLAMIRALKKRYGSALEIVVHDHDLYCPRRHYYTPFGRCNCSRAFSPMRCLLCAMVSRPQNWGKVLRTPFAARLAELRTCRATVLSEFMKDNLVKNGFVPELISVVPPPVPQCPIVRLPPPAGSPLRILFMGQFIAGKGCDLLLDAMAKLTVPWHLVLAGDGPDREKLEVQAVTLKGGSVKFAGWVADPSALLNETDVVAFPSRWQEPYGLSGAEAVARGVPVVAFDVGGVRSWATEICRLIPPNDTVAFARALEEFAHT